MKLFTLIITLLLITTEFLHAGKLQDADFATEAQVGAASRLLNDTKIYLTGSGQTLDDAITTGTLVSATAQLDANFAVKNVTDLTKQFRVSLGAGSTMTGVTLSFSQTADSFYSFPDGTTNIVGHDRNQVLTNKTMDYTLNTFLNFPSASGTSSMNQLSGDVSTGGAVPSYVTNAQTTVFAVGTVPAYKIKNQSDFIDQGSAYYSTSKLVSTNPSGYIETNLSGSSNADGVGVYRLKDPVNAVDSASSFYSTSKLVSTSATGFIETNITGSSNIDGAQAYRVKDPIVVVDSATAELSTSKLVSTNAAGEIKTRIVSSFIEGISTASIVSGTSLISTATALASSSTIVSRNAFGQFAGDLIGSITGSSVTITSVLDVSHGGTGGDTTQTAMGSLLPLTTKGDILVRTALGFDRLPVGSAGFVLTAAPVTSTAGIEWQPSSGGSSTPQNSEYISTGGNGTGSTATMIRRYLNVRKNVGTDFTCSDSATAGQTCTINTTGVYDVSMADCQTGASDNFGITLNDTQTTTGFSSMSNAGSEQQMVCSAGTTNYPGSCSATMLLLAGDVIRAHKETASGNCTGEHQVSFHMTRIGN